MRYWKKLVAGGAAMLISAGSARATEMDAASAQQEPRRDGKSDEQSRPASTRAYGDFATTNAGGADGSGYVTHDELERLVRERVEQLERERNARVPPPTFTDAG